MEIEDRNFDLPDDVLDKHFSDKSDEVEEAPEPEAEDDSPEDELEDNADEAPEDEDEDNEEDEAGEEDEESDPDEEESDEEEDEDEDNLDEEDPAEASFLPKIDLEKIRANPELNATYKHMQAAFTRRMMEASTVQKEANSLKGELEAFVEEIASDAGATDFLIKMALARPEVFRAAQDRAEELIEDPDEKRRYEREQDIQRREQDLKRHEREVRAVEQERKALEIEKATAKMAAAYKMDDTELLIAQQYVANAIYRARSEGRDSISAEEITGAVKRAASDLALKKARVREEAAREAVAKEKALAKEKAKRAKRPPAPRTHSAPAKRKAAPIEVPAGEDRLLYMLDKRISGD